MRLYNYSVYSQSLYKENYRKLLSFFQRLNVLLFDYGPIHEKGLRFLLTVTFLSLENYFWMSGLEVQQIPHMYWQPSCIMEMKKVTTDGVI